MTIGIQHGIAIGVAFSLIVFIWRSSHPHTAELGYLEKEDVFRNVKHFPQARTYPHALIFRVDASLHFANMKFFEDRLHQSIADRPDTKWVIIDLSGVNDIDAVAISVLDELMDAYGERGIQFAFAAIKGPVLDLVARAGWREKHGRCIEYLSVKHALRGIGLMGAE